MPLWPALTGAACQQRLPPSSLLCTGAVRDTSDQSSSKLVPALRCKADAKCLPVLSALAGAACQQRLPPSSLLCTGTVRNLSVHSLECAQEVLANKCCRLHLCLQCVVRDFRQVQQACGCSSVGARRMQTVCLSGWHSHEPLADKGCRRPLCFAWKPSEISPTSHRASFVGALRCKADANCLPL